MTRSSSARRFPRNSHLIPLAALALLSTSAISACSDPLSCGCTDIFVMSVIEVTDLDGQPAVGVTITVTRTSDGTVVTPNGDTLSPGSYTIMTDAQLEFIDESGTDFRVEGTLGAASFSVDVTFDTDSCRCHINKVAGPDEVQLVAGN